MNEKTQELISFARQFVGTPYAWGASEGQEQAFDCSSFMQHIFAHVGITLPRSSILQATDPQGTEVVYTGIDSLLPGDILFMRSDRGYYHDEAFNGRQIYVGHVALYIGDGLILHAKKSLGGVVLQKLEELMQNPHYAITYAKRVL